MFLFPLVFTPREHRNLISSENNFFLCYNGKTAKDGEYLGFSFGPDDFIKCRQVVRKEGTKTWKNSGSEMPTEKLPLEERWSARYFSLDKVLEPVIIEEQPKKRKRVKRVSKTGNQTTS